MTRSEILELLFKGHTHSVKDVLWGNIPFTKEMKDILDVESVSKLSGIKQNGPTYHIYPGSVHTRLNHSIGVYALSRDILLSIGKKNEECPLTEEGIWSFLIASLLHDIGHFPYAHSLKELAIMEHEELAYEIIKDDEKLRAAIEKAGGKPEKVALIIDSKKKNDDPEVEIYRKILSGTLDPDKLDYLSRDAYFSGVPYGIQNTGYIISSLDLKGGKLVLEEDALLSVEHILFSKYMMYKSIYWHKGTRSATAMIKKALLLAIRDNVIKIEDLYFKDDKEFLRIAEEKKSFPPFSLIINAEMGHLFERKCSHPLSRFKKISENSKNLEKRLAIEDMLFALLKEQGEEIKSYEVIIDIPEPIKFENDMHILRHDGSISLPREGESIFFGENGKLFSENLRRLSIFLPENVSEEHLLSSLEKLEREL